MGYYCPVFGLIDAVFMYVLMMNGPTRFFMRHVVVRLLTTLNVETITVATSFIK